MAEPITNAMALVRELRASGTSKRKLDFLVAIYEKALADKKTLTAADLYETAVTEAGKASDFGMEGTLLKMQDFIKTGTHTPRVESTLYPEDKYLEEPPKMQAAEPPKKEPSANELKEFAEHMAKTVEAMKRENEELRASLKESIGIMRETAASKPQTVAAVNAPPPETPPEAQATSVKAAHKK